jgi:hypothetical protein
MECGRNHSLPQYLSLEAIDDERLHERFHTLIDATPLLQVSSRNGVVEEEAFVQLHFAYTVDNAFLCWHPSWIGKAFEERASLAGPWSGYLARNKVFPDRAEAIDYVVDKVRLVCDGQNARWISVIRKASFDEAGDCGMYGDQRVKFERIILSDPPGYFMCSSAESNAYGVMSG